MQYRNPVCSEVPFADPSVIKAQDGNFYVYASEVTFDGYERFIGIYKSPDMVHWTYTGKNAFPTWDSRPKWETKGQLWSPEVNYINGKYVMYYSMSTWGGVQTCGIGVAVADSPEGPFIDKGVLIRSNEIGVINSVDGTYLDDGDKKYLIWGSYGAGAGLWCVELTEDGLNLKNANGSDKTRLTGAYGVFEGTSIHKRGKYYYLFTSRGSCCAGLSSTYTTVVGRSENVRGPYTNKAGQSMLNDAYENVIVGNNVFNGVGGPTKILQDKTGEDWIFYHGFDKNNPASEYWGWGYRFLFLDKIVWIDDWPTVEGGGGAPAGTPSIEYKMPKF